MKKPKLISEIDKFDLEAEPDGTSWNYKIRRG